MAFLSSVFGAKPKIADYTPVDLTAEQLKAIQGNIANFSQFTQLGNMYQQYMLDQYESAIPGFRDILKAGGATTAQMLGTAKEYLGGQIPQDVQEAVQRSSAFQNLMAGGGGAMAQANTARQFGLTSMDLIGQGAQLQGQAGNAAQRWAGLAQAGGPPGMLTTTQQQAALDMQQNLIKRNIQQQRYNVEAAPDPALQALNQWVEQVGGTVVGSYLGGGMGGKGGDYKTSFNASSYGAGDVGAAFGPQMDAAFAGSDAYGNALPAGGSAFNASGPSAGSGGYYGGYGGVSPGSDGRPAYSGIANNPFTGAPSTMWDQYAYQNNFTGGNL